MRVWGDTAVVTARLWLKGTSEGKPFERRLWFSDTYVRTKCGWRYVFGQASLALPKEIGRSYARVASTRSLRTVLACAISTPGSDGDAQGAGAARKISAIRMRATRCATAANERSRPKPRIFGSRRDHSESDLAWRIEVRVPRRLHKIPANPAGHREQ